LVRQGPPRDLRHGSRTRARLKVRRPWI
jgi:hypothetical protein